MNVKTILHGVKNYFCSLKSFSKQKNLNFIMLLIDCVYSYIVYGCVLNHFTVGRFYQRKNFERRHIFTYRQWEKVINKYNGLSVPELQDKVFFNRMFAEFIHRDWLFCRDMSENDFELFTRKHDKFIVKPYKGSEGLGIRLLHNEPGMYKKLKGEDLIIEEYIYQHPDMIFGNNSVNTIRLYTICNPTNRTVTILKSVIRVGVGDSIVDNSHAGGCAYEVDKATGFVISSSYEANGDTNYIHPHTDICMLGRKIPFWENVLILCRNAALLIPQCRFIGWDVAITKDGPLLIEGNHTPDLDMIEFVGSYGYLDKIINNISE